MSKTKKAFLIIGISLAVIVIVIIACISPITEYLIEKYDKKYTGREINMDWAYVNPFTGYVYFNNLKINEYNSDTVFFSTKGLTINIGMIKLLSKHYEVSEFTLNKPRGIIIQGYKSFNFDDLIEKFSSKDEDKKDKDPVHFKVNNIKIKNGLFIYRETVTPIYYFVKNVDIESTGFNSDVDTIPIQFSLSSGIGSGEMNGNFTINSKNKDYRLKVKVKKFDLNIVGQYIKDMANYGSFRAFLDADFNSNGNLVERDNVTNSGKLKISDFHFGKNPKEDYASFEKLEVAIHEVSPRKLIYFFDSIALTHPYFKYEKYDYLDNVQRIFGTKGANVKAANADVAKFNLVIEIANYMKILSKNFLRSNYRVDRLALYRGDIKYNDYSLNEKFSLELDPFTFTADSVDKRNKRVNFDVTSGIKPYGSVAIGMSINPKDSSDFDFSYNFKKLPTTMFNPYLIKYTSFPLDRGTIELKGNWNVRNGKINSTNHLVIIDPRVGDRLKNRNLNWLPLRVIMFVVRERGNVIDYEVPIKGDLNDPKFVLRDVIFDALENIFVKPPTTPYTIEVRNIETAIEKSLSLKWEMRNSLITRKQEHFLEDMAEFIDKNPEANITVTPQYYTLKEKEAILFFEAKKNYFLHLKGKNRAAFTADDSLKVEHMSVKDSLFVRYLNDKTQDTMLFTVQDKCARIISNSIVDAKFNALNQQRVNVFMDFFKEKGSVKRVHLLKAINLVPFNGYSFFKIEYKGDFPENLLKAYQKMNELNNESPRDKHKRQVPKNLVN